jgi:hypothetical protein
MKMLNSFEQKVRRMRTRSDLHITKLKEFEEFCKTEGWETKEVKSLYEVLRMRKDNQWLIVHRKDSATEHLTVWGNSAEMLRHWFKKRKKI